MHSRRRTTLRTALAIALFLPTAALAQAPRAAETAPRLIKPILTKADPPNWFAGMPKPMLLLQGEHLDTAHFLMSDKTLRIKSQHISANGHWAELWLDRSPRIAETIKIRALRGQAQAQISYTFLPRRRPSDGFAGFSSADVMYLIMTDRFADGDPSNDHQTWDAPDEKQQIRGWHGGDLRGITNHLDYLQELGITTVWITPVYQNHGEQSYHGYGATDLYAVDEHFGTLKDLQALAAALHQRRMKLVLDMVPNHIGPNHPWVIDSPEPDWFHGTKAQHSLAQGDFAPLTDPHAPWRDRKNVTEGWFANVLPDMNQENPAAAQYLIQNAEWWVEQAGADGIRLDTFPYVGREFWQHFHAALHQLYPSLTTVGEVFNGDPTIVSSFAGGVTRNGADTALYTPFDFPSYFALRDVFLRGAPFTRLADIFRLDALYPHPERLVPFLGNHDTTRFLNEPGATPQKLTLAFAVLATMRGMPEIYSGDEIAMRGGEDPDNRHNFPGGFQGDSQNAFDPAARTPEQIAIHDAVATLLHLRAMRPALQSGEEQIVAATDTAMAYVRGSNLEKPCTAAGTERILIVINNQDQPQTLTIPTANTSLAGCTTASGLLPASATANFTSRAVEINLPSQSVAIFRLSQ